MEQAWDLPVKTRPRSVRMAPMSVHHHSYCSANQRHRQTDTRVRTMYHYPHVVKGVLRLPPDKVAKQCPIDSLPELTAQPPEYLLCVKYSDKPNLPATISRSQGTSPWFCLITQLGRWTHKWLVWPVRPEVTCTQLVAASCLTDIGTDGQHSGGIWLSDCLDISPIQLELQPKEQSWWLWKRFSTWIKTSRLMFTLMAGEPLPWHIFMGS